MPSNLFCMAYVDLNRRRVKRHSGPKKLLFILLGIVLVLAVVYFLPLFSLFKHILKSPAVFSFIRDPNQELSETDGRTNFLILGIDKRANIPYTYTFGNGEVKKNGFLSDTIIVASVNFKTKDVALLSLPRDLWVKIPGWAGTQAQYAKINSASSIGSTFNYPGGGEALAKEVVSQNLEIPIHYVIRSDFEGFEKAIDIVGGIDVYVDYSFDDYMYPREGYENAFPYESRFEHISFKEGWTKMNGSTALKFVRSRQGTNGEGSDFARAHRQQKVILAFRERALGLQTLIDPTKLSGLIDNFAESVFFDVPLSGAGKIYELAKSMDPNSLRNQVLEFSGEDPFLINPPLDDYGGAWVLIPKNNDWGQIHKFVKIHFGLLPSPTPTASASAKPTKAPVRGN